MKIRKMATGLIAVMVMAGWTVCMAQDESDNSAQARAEVYSMGGFSSSHARLGVMIENITPRLKEKEHLTVSDGAYVNDVVDGGPAEKAGLEEGDVIVKFGEGDIASAEELTKAMRKFKPGKEVTVGYLRKGEKKSVTVKLDRERGSSFSYNFTPQPMQRFRMPSMPKMPHAFSFSMLDNVAGLSLQELSRQLAEYFEVPGNHGLLVTEVSEGSDAEKAGVKAGDVIVKVNSSTVHTVQDLREEMNGAKNHEANLDVIRKGKSLSVKIHVDEELNDDDADAGVQMMDKSISPGQCSPGVPAKIFSREFVTQLLDSISDLKSRLLRHVSLATEKIKSALTASFSPQGAKSDSILHS